MTGAGGVSAESRRAWMLRRTGGPHVLERVTLPVEPPGPGEVAVRVEAIGINYAEVLSRKGLYGWAPERPYVPGMEAVGVVVGTGPGVDAPAPGTRVMCGMQHGAYSDRVVVPAGQALPALDHLSLEESAAYGVAFMTAWVALVEVARLRPSDRVGITAAAGGVGTAAVQIASSSGCHVVAMVGSEEKVPRVRALGAADAVVYGGEDFGDRLDATLEGRGLDVVLEVVGSDVYRALLSRLAPFGRIVVAGYAGLDYRRWNPLSWWRAWRGVPRLDVVKASSSSIGVSATHLGYLLADEARLRAVWAELSEFTRAHRLRPVVGRTYGFEELPEAHRFMESRRSVGKLVVLVQ